jgi:pyruvate,orthophosphate dikinase
MGLCGEHGAEPANIPFAREAGLDYVSCSPYGIPIAKLAIAQLNLPQQEAE